MRINRAACRETMLAIKKNRISYAFIAPFYLLFIVFTILPVCISIFFSFTSYNILEPPKLVGWSNYSNLLMADDVFMIAFKNTMIYALIVGPVSYIVSLLIAWMIADMNSKFRAFLVLLFYAPSISGNMYLIWKVLFSSDSYGYINSCLTTFGFVDQPIKWLPSKRIYSSHHYCSGPLDELWNHFSILCGWIPRTG